MTNSCEKIISQVKDIVFDLSLEEYKLTNDDIGDYSLATIKKNKPRHKEISDEICWRLQDYELAKDCLNDGLNEIPDALMDSLNYEY